MGGQKRSFLDFYGKNQGSKGHGLACVLKAKTPPPPMHDFARILETPLCLRAYLMYAPYLTHENAH